MDSVRNRVAYTRNTPGYNIQHTRIHIYIQCTLYDFLPDGYYRRYILYIRVVHAGVEHGVGTCYYPLNPLPNNATEQSSLGA